MGSVHGMAGVLVVPSAGVTEELKEGMKDEVYEEIKESLYDELGKFIQITTIFFLLAVAGCGPIEDSPTRTQEDTLTPIEVEMAVPENAETGEEIAISIKVTQGGNLIGDVNEVIVEIWKENEKVQSVMIEPEKQEGHNFYFKQSFDVEGLYYIQAHVTARDMHRMPTKQIQIGHDELDEHNHKHQHQHTHEAHQSQIKLETSLTHGILEIRVNVDNKFLENGKVTLELWKANEEKHHWLDMDQTDSGVYATDQIEKFSGKYHVIVHIEDNESLHEHIKTELEFY